MWLSKLGVQVDEVTPAATTAGHTYRQRLRAVILSAMRKWRLHERTLPRLDSVFRGVTASQVPADGTRCELRP